MTDKNKKMSDEELKSQLDGIITDAVALNQGVLSQLRAEATEYYLGKPLGNEEEGRSQFILTEVRDGVLGVIPSILRVIFGAERAVEFAPRTADKTEQADQASDYISYIFSEENNGFLTTHGVLKDGLVRKMGVYKWGWDDSTATNNYKLDEITQTQLEMLHQEDGVEITRVTQLSSGQPQLVQANGQPQPPQQEATFAIEFTHTEKDGRPRIWAVPPEEFIHSREARSVEDALFVGHRTRKTKSELLEMGISEKDIDAHGGDDTSLKDAPEAIARDETGEHTSSLDPEAGESNDKIIYVEGYVKIDFDGDGKAELRKVCTIGTANYPVVNEPVEDRPFAVFCPDPEPHTMMGQSWADRLMDLQRVKTSLVRTTLDSLSASVFPRTAYVEGQVNVADILNTDIGAPIRMRAPGMVQPFALPFVGKEAFPFFEYFDGVVERRTGRNAGTMGLDADALQSTTKTGVGAAITSAQEQTELLSRIFVEQTLKPLFRGLLKLLVQHQPKKKMARLRGKWVDVDPRSWDASMDCVVSAALGTSLVEAKVATLTGLTQKQELLLQTLGPTNPVVSLAQYAQTLKKILELQGFKDTQPYLNQVDPNWQPPAQQPQETPEQTLAKTQLQVEQMRVQKDMAIKQAEMEHKQQMDYANLEHKKQQAIVDSELRRFELQLKYGLQANQSQVDTAMQQQEMDHSQSVAEHDQMMAQQQHEQQQQQADEQHQQEQQQSQEAHDNTQQQQQEAHDTAQAAPQGSE